jgi:uncharacterized membrane protein YgcG
MHAVLATSGIATEMHRTSIIVNEGFTSLVDFGLLSEKDVYEMVKRMGSRTAAAGRVYVGTLQVKKLQALCYWVRDQQKHGQALDHEDWNNEMVVSTIERMRIYKERDTGAVSVSDLGKFDPEEFETGETAFVNLLSQTRGTQGESLKYVARDAVVPAVFADDAERRMYQLPLTGGAFEEDNKQTFRLLKSYLINTPGWTWIESFDVTENGGGAFLAWATHYNGQGELLKCTAMAKAKIKNLFYKNEQSLTFEKVMEILSKSFSILDKDPDERLSERQKVEKLLSCIQTQDMEMVAQKLIIASQYPNDFSGACNYFSAQVSRLHAGAQLENSKYKNKRNISAMQGRGGGRDGSRGRGHGHFGGRSGSGGRGNGGRSGGRGNGNGSGTKINGVNVADPTHSFTNEEWEQLAWNGSRQYVTQARERMNGRGRGRGGQGGRSSGGGRNASGTASDRNQGETDTNGNEQTQGGGNGDRGAQHGRGFGRGAYPPRR